MAWETSTREEENLDELDDIIDQFGPSTSDIPLPPKQTSANINNPTSLDTEQLHQADAKETNKEVNDDLLKEGDFAKQLAEGMEEFIKQLSDGGIGNITEEERKTQEAWEKMLIEGMSGLHMNDAEASSSSTGSGGSSHEPPTSEDDFQKTIQQAMKKLKDSDSTLQMNAASTSSSSDPLDNLLNQLGSGFEDNFENNEELQSMLEGMMHQLISKDVLYEPLKELHEKFPQYISEHATTLSADDKGRYEKQLECISKIMNIFEDPSYTDEDKEKGAYIMDLMNEMQSLGSPPSEIMGPLPPAFDFRPDGSPNLPEGCIVM